jgi:uncharacterized protein YjbI with pentapeptide repeats
MSFNDVDQLVASLAAIAASPSDGFLELVLSAKLDPASDFVGADLSGMDLSGLDLTEFDFTGADLTNANLVGSILRADLIRGARLNRQGVRILEEALAGPLQPPLPLAWRSDQRMLDGILRTYQVQRYALERIALLIEFIQSSPDLESLEKLLANLSRREKSTQVRRFIEKWRGSPIDMREGGFVGSALNIAVRNIHPLNRANLIYAIGRHVTPSPDFNSYFRQLLQRTRSVRLRQAIAAILRSDA